MTYIQEKQINDNPAFNKEDWASAYKNVEKELTNEPLNTTIGANIDELNGTLFRNGPGILERGGQWVHHPFDAVSYTHLRAHET